MQGWGFFSEPSRPQWHCGGGRFYSLVVKWGGVVKTVVMGTGAEGRGEESDDAVSGLAIAGKN